MILTGKAKEAFEKWSEGIYDDCGNGQVGKRLFYIQSMDDYRFINTEHYIYNVGDSMLQAIIIEWMDSVGVYVETGVYPCQEDGNIYFSGSFFGKLGGWDDLEYHNTRQQAAEKAIIKAVEIYNKRGN